MTQEAINNGIVLYDLHLDRKQVETSLYVMHLVPELLEILSSPIISNTAKHEMIDRIYSGYDCPKPLINFLKVMCDHREISELNDIYNAYYDYWDEKNRIKRVQCIFAEEPDKNKIEEIRYFLQQEYADQTLMFHICIDPKILGGVIIRIGHKEYNWSFEDRVRQLEKVIRGTAFSDRKKR